MRYLTHSLTWISRNVTICASPKKGHPRLMAETKITLEQVRHVARLARLRLSPDEEERVRSDMDEMLAYVDKLNELDTEDVAPTAQVGEAGTPMREDEVTNQPAADAMLANAPSRERNYFKVPKIIE